MGKPLAAIGVVIAISFGVAIFWKQRSLAPEMSLSEANLREITFAFRGHAQFNGNRLPPQAIYSPDGKPLLSWRVLILPYLEQVTLFQQFKLDEPWDSPHNVTLLKEMPRVYAPVHGKTPESFSTYYQVFVGPGAAFEGPKGLTTTRADFPDGITETLLVVEGAKAVPWTKPDDLAYAPDGPLPGLGGQFDGICLAAFGDGRIKRIEKTTPEDRIRASITRNGGEQVGLIEPADVAAAKAERGEPQVDIEKLVAKGMEGVPELLEAAGHADANTRAAAIRALGSIQPASEATIQKLIPALKDPEAAVRVSTIRALHKVGPETIPALIGALKDSSVLSRRNAAVVLGYHGEKSKAAVPALLEAAKAPEPFVRQEVLGALGSIRAQPELVVPVLMHGLQDADEEVRQQALGALGNFGSAAKKVEPRIVELIRESPAGGLPQAARAIRRISPEP